MLENTEVENTELENQENNEIDLQAEGQETVGEYPEGFDAEIYNLETKSLREDKVKERLEANKKLIESLEKQKYDLRKIISKGKTTDLKDYEMYKPDSKYSKYYTEDEKTKETFKNFNQLSQNAGLNTEQHKMVADFMNEVLEKVGVFDTRTEEQKQLQLEDWRRQEYKKIGDNAEIVIKKNVDFIKNYNFLNEEQKKELTNFATANAMNLSIVNTFRNILEGSGKDEIPTSINAGGLPTDKELWNEFLKADDTRKEQIIKDRIKAGRPSDWSF